MRSRWHWHRRLPNKKKALSGLFGGSIRSDEEIRSLDAKIEQHERKKLEEAEEQLEKELEEL